MISPAVAKYEARPKQIRFSRRSHKKASLPPLAGTIFATPNSFDFYTWSNGTITKTGATGWDHPANITHALASGLGSFSFTPQQTEEAHPFTDPTELRHRHRIRQPRHRCMDGRLRQWRGSHRHLLSSTKRDRLPTSLRRLLHLQDRKRTFTARCQALQRAQ